MARIAWPAAVVDITGIIATRFDEPLRAVVAIGAQALQFAGQESIPVTVMRLDMIDDSRRFHNATLQAQPAQRLGAELETTPPFPSH